MSFWKKLFTEIKPSELANKEAKTKPEEDKALGPISVLYRTNKPYKRIGP